ncbi:tyrosine-protein phosphatase [Nocardioides pakistanensis]
MNHPRLPDLRNLRDVGGLRTGDGRRVRNGVLLRSATPFFLDAPQAHALVEELGVRTRVDLRSEVEIEELPNEHVSSLPHQAVHLPLRAGGEWAHHTDPVDRHEAVAAHYARYLRHSADSITRIASLAADPDSAAMLVHCSAGKDRTGVAVAVLLSAAGVVHDEIVADYARTREDLDAMLDQLRTLPAYKERLAALPEESLTAEPRTMELFLAHLEAEYGGAAGYLTAHGVGGELLDGLRRALLES